MKKGKMYSFSRSNFTKNLSALLLLSIAFPWQAFATEELFRETKDNFSPHPFVQPNLSTGVFTHSRPITTPPGRNGIQPNIKLTYNSSNGAQDSLVGYGWSLNIPFIERLNKNGIDKLYNQDLSHSFFYSTLSGELLKIATTTPVVGSFLGFSFSLPRLSYLHFAQLDSASSGNGDSSVTVTTTNPDDSSAIKGVFFPSTSIATTTPPQPPTASDDPSLSPVVFPVQDGSSLSSATTNVLSSLTSDNAINPDGSIAVAPGTELTGERSASAKRFFDGLAPGVGVKIRTEYFTHPIHYLDSKIGSYQDIDSRLATTSAGFVMTHAQYQAALDTSGATHLIVLQHDGKVFAVDALGGPLTSNHAGQFTDAQTSQHSVTYPNLLGSSMDLEVTTLDERFIKEAVLKDSTVIATTTGDYLEIPFRLTFNTPVTVSADGKTMSTDTPLITSSAATITDGNDVLTRILPPTAISSVVSTSSDQHIIPIDIVYAATTSGIVMTKRIPVSFLRTAVYPVRTDATFDFYPTTSTVDGYVGRAPGGSGESYSTIRNGAGNEHNDTAANASEVRITSDPAVSGNYVEDRRWIGAFDTSNIGPYQIPSAATLSVYGVAKNDSLSQSLNVYQPSSATTTSLLDSEYNIANWNTTPLSTSMTLTSFDTGGYNNFPLNALGVAAINSTGLTTLGMAYVGDMTNIAPTWVANQDVYTQFYNSEQAGTSQDPKLEVVTSDYAPTTLQVESQSNPIAVATSNPRFSALFAISSTTALATSYQIQISTSSTSWTNPYWDSAKLTLSSSTPSGQRTPQIFSTTTFALDQTKYYWRMKVWDQMGSSTAWSSSGDYFIMGGSVDYGSKVETGDFLRYTHAVNNNDMWIAYDKHGVKYIFGSASSSRMFNTTGTGSTPSFRWMLDSMTDPNGNTMSYTYATDSNQVYPTKITYTANGASAGIYEMDFVYENRSDIATSSNAGFTVVTKQRIREILVYTNGQLTHRYQLGYGVGDNAYRSMLTSMQESGWNATLGTTTLPAVTFAYSTSSATWTQNTDGSKWVLPSNYFVDGSGVDTGARVFDVTGDALPDLIFGSSTYKNTGTSWVSTTSVPAIGFTSVDNGTRLGDINGDGYVDEVQSENIPGTGSAQAVYFGGANGFTGTTSQTQFIPPMYFIDNNVTSTVDYGVRLVDVNGDGLADIVQSQSGSLPLVYINNGSQWIYDATWSAGFPTFITYLHADAGVRFADVNGDGLTDIAVSRGGCGYTSDLSKIYLNNGAGWTEDPTWEVSFGAFVGLGTCGGDTGKRFVDANGDGLPDIGPYDGYMYMNTGRGWASSTSAFPTQVINGATNPYTDYGVTIDDINGDGVPDVVRNGGSTKTVWLKDGVKGDLLTRINTEKGGAMTMTYSHTSALSADGTQPNPSLQISFDSISTITNDPGFGGQKATATYAYKGGLYYYGDINTRQFAGFASSTQTNDLGHTMRTYYHQGNSSDSSNGEYNDSVSKIGMSYRTEDLDGTGASANVYSRTINKWARADYGDGRNFVKLVQTLKQIYDGDTTHRDTAASSTYDDTNGNIIKRDNWGEVTGASDGTFTDVGSDAATTTYSYAASSTLPTMSLVARELMNDQSSTTVRDTKWYYDSLGYGSVSKGNQTKEERLISGTTYASTTKTYDAYGNVLVFNDPRNGTTTNVYDTYNLYPATSTNALGFSTTFMYDYATGKVSTTTDINGFTFATVYDALGRPTIEKQPDFTTPTTLVTKATYTYSDSTSSPVSIFQKAYVNAATTSDSYVYVDGLGRTIQSKKEAESANGWITKDTIYNNIGSVASSSLPYFSTTSSRTVATTTSYLYTNNYYDPEGRLATITDAVGTTKNTYADWRLTITDALSNKKDLIKDAWGNLYQTVEYLSASNSATTTNTWNLLGKLTKFTDAAGNIRNFTYDNLGRLLTSEDLHAPAHTLFDTSTWTYDVAGNVTSFLNPRNQTISYTYDALNRPLTEDYTGGSGTEISYTYDTCTNGKGKLCQSVRQGGATTTYAYNPIGLVGTTSIMIGTTWGTTTTSYLRSGVQDTLVYPNNRKVMYIYNDAGMLNKTLSLAPASTTWRNVIESTNYSPTGQPTFIDYGNNTQTTYTYDATALYRLTRKLTVSTSTTPGVPESLSL